MRGKHCGLASRLLERLPLFDEASVSEVLDIRRELDGALVRFRSAMIKFSEQIKTAAWDEDFSFEAEQVFQRDVAPAILDIEEAVCSNKYLSSLARLDSIKTSKLRRRFNPELLHRWDHVILSDRLLLELSEDVFACADACFVVERMKARTGARTS